MKLTPRRLTPLFILLAVLATTSFAQTTDQGLPEQYSATAFITSGAAQGKSVEVNIYVDRYSTDEERQDFLNVLKTKGQDGLETAFDKAKPCGRVAIVGTTGNTVSYIRAQSAETKRIIRMATNRTISFPELWTSPRSRDYKFGIVELRLDSDGKGEGTLLYATKVKFNKKGELELEHYGQSPVRLANVRKQK